MDPETHGRGGRTVGDGGGHDVCKHENSLLAVAVEHGSEGCPGLR